MNTLTRHLTALVATLALAATAAGCANTPTATPTTDVADSQAALDAINNASEITATKSLLSWGLLPSSRVGFFTDIVLR